MVPSDFGLEIHVSELSIEKKSELLDRLDATAIEYNDSETFKDDFWFHARVFLASEKLNADEQKFVAIAISPQIDKELSKNTLAGLEQADKIIKWQKQIAPKDPVIKQIHLDKQNSIFETGMAVKTSAGLKYSNEALKTCLLYTDSDEEDEIIYEQLSQVAFAGVEFNDFEGLSQAHNALKTQRNNISHILTFKQKVEIENNIDVVSNGFVNIGDIASLQKALEIAEAKAGIDIFTREEQQKYKEKRQDILRKINEMPSEDSHALAIFNDNTPSIIGENTAPQQQLALKKKF